MYDTFSLVELILKKSVLEVFKSSDFYFYFVKSLKFWEQIVFEIFWKYSVEFLQKIIRFSNFQYFPLAQSIKIDPRLIEKV